MTELELLRDRLKVRSHSIRMIGDQVNFLFPHLAQRLYAEAAAVRPDSLLALDPLTGGVAGVAAKTIFHVPEDVHYDP